MCSLKKLKKIKKKQAITPTVKYRGTECRWQRESCLIKSASVMLDMDSTPVEKPKRWLTCPEGPSGGCLKLCLSPRGKKGEVRPGSVTRVGAHAPRY